MNGTTDQRTRKKRQERRNITNGFLLFGNSIDRARVVGGDFWDGACLRFLQPAAYGIAKQIGELKWENPGWIDKEPNPVYRNDPYRYDNYLCGLWRFDDPFTCSGFFRSASSGF